MHQMLNKAFDQARKWRRIPFNPVKDADPPSIKREEMEIWSIESINQFLNANSEEKTFLVFFLALYTGMRRGEILGLKWEDIDFEKKTIFVNRSLAFVPEKRYIFTNLKTTKSKRQIPISNEVIQKILQYKAKQDEWKERLKAAFEDNDLVVCTEMGKPQDPQNVLRVMQRLCKKAKVPKIRFHDLRHTHASLLLNSGVDPVKVAARLGHANRVLH
ncbi:site-specific integrase [Cytobacillus sp. Hz8]|uniref:site-specific integrase n=1 Tax=Cytobacillus sp. Hz8 TaxID=3347168 RepID=UPI0035DBDDBF